MRIIKKWLLALTAFSMAIGLITVTSHVQAASADANTYIKQLIAYYRDYQEDAETDIQRVLQELKAVDETKYEAWNKIMNYWSYANTDMVVNNGVAPDGLPNDDSVCIVILGLALNSDGTMKDELIGRLQAGLDTANKYPNAYVVVTGGGTASGNPNVTEGGLMGEWLLDKGLSVDRLIVEDKAPDTVGNAKNTYEILSKNYPDVQSLIMITSDYHVPRGSILFYSKCLLAAYETGGKPLEMISNAGYNTGSKGYETISLQASGVASVAQVSLSGVSVTLSQLSGLTFAQEGEYQTGEDLKLTVTADYDTGYSRDVSDLVTITNFDPSLGANQTITVSYTENGITLSGSFDLSDTKGSVADNTYLRNLIAKVEAMNLSSYTRTSIERLNAALASAKKVVESNTTDNEIIKAEYDALNTAVNKLGKRVNLAKKMNVETNCNQGDASKITDDTITTGNYWASVNNGSNVAASDAEIIIDLGGVYHVDCVQVYPYWGGNRVYKYELYGSKDKVNWEKIGENISDEFATSSGFTHDMAEDIAYVKLVGIETKVDGRPDINNIHIIEMQVYGEDAHNLAYLKPIISSGTDTSAGSSADSADTKVIDGDRSTYWDGGVYADSPWVMVDLETLCQIDAVNVITYWARTDNRYYYYDIYTSLDGKDFTLVHSKKEGTDKATIYGDTFDFTGSLLYARYVKIVGTFDSVNPSFHINELRVLGKAISNELLETRESLKELIEQAETADLTNRTEASVKELQKIIVQSKELMEKPLGSITLDEVNAMLDELNAGILSLEYVNADYTKVDKAIQKAEGLNAEDYIDFSDVQAALDAVVRDKKINEQTAVDAMAKAIEDAIAALEYKSADYTAVDEAIAKAEALVKDDYANFSAVDSAIAAVVRNKKINEQAAVDEMAKAIEDAITALKYKSADYSAVDQAIAKAEALVKNHYLDFSAVDDAVAAVVRNKDLREQAAVDEMAKAIEDAIAALEYKSADYTAVDEAIAKAEALVKDDYMDFSAVDAAVAAVVRDKKINEQAAVDAMASAIDNAIEKLEKKAQISDLAALQAAIDKARALVEADYAPSTWIMLMEAVEAAEATAVKEIVSLTEVNQCIENIEAAILSLKPSIDYRTVTNENVTVSGNMEENVRLVVINTVEKEVTLFKQLCSLTAQYNQKYFEDKELLNIYDIKLLKNNEIYFAKGTLLVQVKLQPEWIGRELEVIYIKDDGTFETVPATITDGAISFSVEHFSYYGIVGSKQSEIDKPSDRPSIKPNDVLKPNDSTLKPNQGIASGVNTGIIVDLSLNLLLGVMCGSVIVVIYMKKKYIRTWK